MIARTFCALAGLTLTVPALPAQSASFNCEKAETASEKAICADSELDDQDVAMSVLYTELKPLLAMEARSELESTQTAWLKRREACGADRACLSRAFADRLFQLRAAFEDLAKRGPF